MRFTADDLGPHFTVPEQMPMMLRTERGWLITIETVARFDDGTAAIDVGGDDADAVAAFAPRLQHEQITTVAVDEEGTLTACFASGARLTAAPDPDYEAWSLCGPGHQRLVCCPGGEVVEWDAKHDTNEPVKGHHATH